jgi:hypothetical protein
MLMLPGNDSWVREKGGVFSRCKLVPFRMSRYWVDGQRERDLRVNILIPRSHINTIDLVGELTESAKRIGGV